jgi:hypothetical protein
MPPYTASEHLRHVGRNLIFTDAPAWPLHIAVWSLGNNRPSIFPKTAVKTHPTDPSIYQVSLDGLT